MDLDRNIENRRSKCVKLPRLGFNNTLIQTKSTNSSFINNNKDSHKMIGCDIHNVYSLKRDLKNVENTVSGLWNTFDTNTTNIKMSKPESHLPLLMNDSAFTFRRKRESHRKSFEDVWRPNDSRKQSYNVSPYKSVKVGQTSERKTPSCQRNISQLGSDPPDNVLTRTRLRALLAKEEAFIPRNVYTNLSARY
jgi:hypothetical protein